MKKKIIIILIIMLIIIYFFIILNNKKSMDNPKVIEDKEIKLIKSEDILEDISSNEFSAKVNLGNYIINALLIDDIYYLFLPRNLDISTLKIKYNFDNIQEVTNGQINKETKTIINDFSENDEIVLIAEDETQYKIKVMKSDVPSICINLDSATLTEINTGSKDEKYSANLQVIGADNEKYNINKTIKIKGRGNSTWAFEKKPYQINFEEKENLLGINGEAEKWILLANYADKTLLKNQLSFDLQKNIGLSDSINGTFIDLYINGEYLGNYNLCDKIDIEEKRVNLKDSKGIIAELDLAFGNTEDNKFVTELTRTTFVIKESVSDEETEEFREAMLSLKESIDKLETLMYAEEPNWEEIRKLIDVESFLKYYFLIELAEDPDRFITSTFLYKDGDDDVIHIGPIWDSDLAFGHFSANGVTETTDYTFNLEKYKGELKQNWYNQLYKNKEFVKLLNEMYEEEIYPIFSKATELIDNYVISMPNSIEMNLMRWYGNMTMTEYNNKIHFLKSFIQSRVAYFNERYSVNNIVMYTTLVKDERITEEWKNNKTWEENWKIDGQTSGLMEELTKVEDIKITLANSDENQNIKYDIYITGSGWQGWEYNGSEFELEEQEVSIQAMKIELEGMPEYKVEYRVYVEGNGWQEWKCDGEIAGVIDGESIVQALEIKVVYK